ncbi:hypothetical protein TPHA_0E03710 [Tetrapisispora phaffii CBS 4417]|uniref:Ribosomal RNA-processing protein 7 C-terminal domain-containing protein n=1 Tax=Tetrapisispora phaffii (strain ATCC 24235 / CBS 4417 / NBRC 1672 / NRRL Y-8282 / UCD 70-5) TaxID=1071381 RepID=G8BU82_TETPH|nr:hypothetical protein TPHA_0E03710 [Tetrapisispora phaffii CBS 4417]CCE63460.1 hypothetical protein TPHA_0E03710 [Tetrapisispora phaffii CBS 4417]
MSESAKFHYVKTMKSGFLVVPFKLPKHRALKKDAGLNNNSFHYVYIKKHVNKDNEEEKNCLFAINLPILSNTEFIKKVFNDICSKNDTIAYIEKLLQYDEFGLEEIDLSSLTSDLMSNKSSEDEQAKMNENRYTPRNTCLIKFVDESSLENCYSSIKKYCDLIQKKKEKANFIEWEYVSPSITTFINFYKPIDIDYLKEDISLHMKIFEERENTAREEAQSSIVDEDGFTLVVGKNTKSLNSIKKKILNKNPLLKHKTKAKQGNSMVDKKVKQDFYRFQVRERKKQEINELLSKFKDDQERIKVMKAKKKFNPYNNSL